MYNRVCKQLDITSPQTILQTCASAHSKQVLDVPISAIIHLVWFLRIMALSVNISMSEFTILKNFKVMVHPRTGPVLWCPPICGWIKSNMDACGSIFRDSRGSILGCFSLNLHVSRTLCAKCIGARNTIEIAHRRGWNKLWLKCDSSLVELMMLSSL
ncbi:hypothetical protein GmHk_07G020016 [Glycine max]|nr:hypothetical protein GmHk_07G020016 [Glycine max]